MPITKSAKKQMRQNRVHRARNFQLRSELKTTVTKALKLAKEGKAEELKKFSSFAYSVIDKANKKNIIHRNNAARKKSLVAKALEKAIKKGASKPVEEKKEAKKTEKAQK